MNELKRTIIYVVVAAASVGAASATYYVSRPRADAEYSLIGKPFYPEFQDPTAAQVLRVVAYDEPTASVKEFKVEYKDGKWTIPSHHNYPADGKDRLARTAASVIGTSRVFRVSRQKSEEARYNTVDPEDPGSTLAGRGQKITIAKNDGTVLAEYVIGKKVEGERSQGQSDEYFVRATHTDDADSTYIAKLKVDLSTKFSDWIEPSLLKVDRDNLNSIRIDSYSIDQEQGAIIPGDVTELTRKSSTDQWKLTGLHEDREELKTDAVNQLINQLDGLRLVGVRPKPPGVNADLSLDSRFEKSPQAQMVLKTDMINHGFVVARDPRDNGKPHVFSKEGELEAGTNDGVRYALRFGQIFTGTEFEIETGLSKDADKAKQGAKKDEKKPKDELKKSRYLMVYATFDPKLLGEMPAKPNEPKKPNGLVLDKPANSNTKTLNMNSSTSKAGSKSGAAQTGKTDHKQSRDGRQRSGDMLAMALPDPPATPKGTANSSEPAKPVASPKAAPVSKTANGASAQKQRPAAKTPPTAAKTPAKPDPKAEYQKALAQYKKDVEKYDNDKSEYEKKLKKGQETVKQLNQRFAPWYYVISAESFENLHLNRSGLVKEKEKPAATKTKPPAK